MAGIRVFLGHNALQQWSYSSHRGRSDDRRCARSQECRCSGGRGLNPGSDAVLKQIKEIEAGLNELSGCRIPGQGQDRVKRLLDRLNLLTMGVERSIDSGGNVPAQLMAALNALQREQSSLANIIRLASVAIVPVRNQEEENVLVRGEEESTEDSAMDKSSSKEDVMNSLKRESALVAVKEVIYEMSAPATKNSSMASVRAEIERRVIQQLTGGNGSLVSTGTSDEEDGKASFALETEGRRVELAELQLSKLEIQLGKTIPVEVHESLVETLQESLREAQLTVQELTRELTVKETMMKSVKKDVLNEQGVFLNKLSSLRCEIAARATNMEELETAVSEVVDEFSRGLQEIQRKAAVLSAELDTKEKQLIQLKKDWKTETKNLRKKLANSRKQIKELQDARKCDQAELAEAKNKIAGLEDQLFDVRQDYEDAEACRKKQQQESLARMKTLIAEMVKISRARSEREAEVSELLKEIVVPEKEEVQPRRDNELSLIRPKPPTDEKLKRLQSFFSVMRELLSKTIPKKEG